MNLAIVQTFIGLTLLGLCFSRPCRAQSMKPGLWKSHVQFKVNGIPLPSTEDEDCVLPSEAKDAKSALMKDLSKKGCSLTKWEVKGPLLDAALVCKNKDLNAKGKIKGQFSSKAYDLKGEAKGKYKNMLPAVATVELKGEWLKSCTK